MVAEHSNGRDLEGRHLADQGSRFFREPIVGQVAAENQGIGRFVHLCEQRLQPSGCSRAAVMKVANRRYPNGLFCSLRHAPSGLQPGRDKSSKMYSAERVT